MTKTKAPQKVEIFKPKRGKAPYFQMEIFNPKRKKAPTVKWEIFKPKRDDVVEHFVITRNARKKRESSAERQAKKIDQALRDLRGWRNKNAELVALSPDLLSELFAVIKRTLKKHDNRR
jgi:hypothetical protein